MTSVNLTLPQWDDLSTKEFSLATFSLIYGYLKLRGLPFFLDENGAIDAQQTTGTLIVARKPPNPGALAVDATAAAGVRTLEKGARGVAKVQRAARQRS